MPLLALTHSWLPSLAQVLAKLRAGWCVSVTALMRTVEGMLVHPLSPKKQPNQNSGEPVPKGRNLGSASKQHQRWTTVDAMVLHKDPSEAPKTHPAGASKLWPSVGITPSHREPPLPRLFSFPEGGSQPTLADGRVQPGPLASASNDSEGPSYQEHSWAGESPTSATTYLIVIIIITIVITCCNNATVMLIPRVMDIPSLIPAVLDIVNMH